MYNGHAPLWPTKVAVIQSWWPYYTVKFLCNWLNGSKFGTWTSGCYRVADHLTQINTGYTVYVAINYKELHT